MRETRECPYVLIDYLVPVGLDLVFGAILEFLHSEGTKTVEALMLGQ
ncbi:hypothetical protein ID866_11723 [Astraeus odoratus]|nr:hypothetical protein ID866_11723 [Astraeus odoratus]